MVNTVWINADNGHNLHLLADHMTQKKNFIKEENHDISAFRFSLQLMLEEALTNLAVCLMISPNCIQKFHKRASMLQWILGRFSFLQKNI